MRLSDFSLVEPGSDREELLARLAELNRTARPYDRAATLHGRIEAVAAAHPERPAVICGGRTCTYRELSERSNRIARFVAGCGARVAGLLLDNSPDLVAAFLGTWKAGAVCLPLNPALPLERLRHMLTDSGAGLLLCQERYLKEANRLQWECPALADYLCLDAADAHGRPEAPNELMSRELWDYVGAEATDDISGGGWVSSYTGEKLSREVMDDYAAGAEARLAPFLDSATRVLEIGCASGITLFRLAPRVGFYYGVDLSSEILAKTESERRRRGLGHVRLRCLPAHEIDLLDESGFDLIVLNSVVQSFHGHNYLRGVLRKALGLLRDRGRIFIGDVMDQDSKRDLVASLAEFKRRHPEAPTKTDWSSELFLARRFWDDLRFDLPAVVRAEVWDKAGAVESELTRFRYDALLTVDKACGEPPPGRPWRRQHGAERLEREPAGPLLPAGEARDPAYIMYTSGSTGEPKGVAVSHRSLVNYGQWACRTYFGNAPAAMPLFTSPAFDLTLTSLVCPLFTGGAVHALPGDDPDRLLAAAFSPGSAVDAVKLTPSHISILGGLDLPFTPVRTAVVGGEDLAPGQVAVLRRLRPDMRIWNEYGPTEATVGCTAGLAGDPPITIGSPIDNTEIWILGAGGDLQPLDVDGELCVAGDGLAIGYWNDPELTAAKFVRHPLRPGERLYRTGDRARWLPAGDLLLLGRIDCQVKIRGNRIELGEVEAALRALPEVTDAVVLDRRDASGEPCLCAYAVAPGATEAGRLREELSRALPDFMVPAHVVLLPELPLNANGKVDRRALPEPGEILRAASGACEPPRTELERTLAGIWKQVLGVGRASLDDGFFDLGGHSLKATQLASRIERALGVRLPLREIFRSPTLRGLSAAVGRARRAAGGGIERLPAAELYEVSHAQRRLWVLQQLEAAPRAYNVLEALRLRGNLDEDALEGALTALVARHESLRTTLPGIDGTPWQRVHPEPRFGLERHDLRGEADPEAAARRHLEALGARGFDLEAGPLVRLALMRLGEADRALGLALHHAVSDGWSAAVLVRDVSELYAARLAGREPDLPPLRIHYRDYAAWQNRQVEEARGHRDYWHARLGGELPALDLPCDFPRPPVKGFAGSFQGLLLPTALLAGLHGLARGREASLFMVLLAGVLALLHRWTGQEDLAVGSPIAGRLHADLEDQIGCYVNTLVLRERCAGETPFVGLLDAVRQTTLGAYEHQVYPFDRLVEELPLPRDTSRSPLFDVLVVLQNTPPARPALPGVTIEPFELPSRTSKLDLSFHFAETPEGLAVGLEYSTELFARDRIARMAGHLTTLLAGLLDDPGLPVRDLPLLPPGELAQILAGSGDIAGLPAADLLEAFAAQAAAHPGRAAVVCGGRTLTYGELDRRAGRLAARLRREGVLPGHVVAVLLGRSEDGVASLLAILRAGASYLPLDPAYPEERLAWMMADSGARVAIARPAEQSLLGRLAAPPPTRIDPDDLPEEEAAPVPPIPEALAYVVYTSGSTGRPKGVAGTRRCLSNLMAWQRSALGDGLRTAQYAALSFDVSVQEMLFAVTSGGTLHVIDETVRLEPRPLAAFLREREIELLTLPFSALGLLFADPAVADGLPALRHLVTSGEQLVLSEPLRQALARRPGLWLHNQYGPSETHVVTSFSLRGQGPLPELPPIGRPLANCRTWVLDPALRPAPVGVAGELCLGGVQLAAGYLRDPALTAVRFVPSPWGEGERLYRTGDLCRLRADGEIEYLGRIDGQVKIRGHRVEPGEIEHALLAHPAVKGAVVLVTAGPDRELVACLAGDALPAAADLRAHLARTLPEPMLPARFVVVPELPRTPSGKADRRALAALDATSLPDAEPVPPATAVERELAAIWEEVLRRGPIGREDRFFALGGHSLRAVQMAAAVERRLGVEVPLLQIFRTPRLRDLAAWIEEIGAYEERHAGDPAVLLNRGEGPVVFALPPILGYGVAFASLAALLDGNALYGLDFIEEDDRLERYARRLGEIHPGPCALFGYSAGGNLAFELARKLERDGRRVSAIVLLDTYRIAPQPPASDEEVEAEIRSNLDYFGRHLQDDPHFAMYVANPQIRELLVRRMGSYIRYLRHADNSGAVRADLHLVYSSDPEADGRRAAWANATTGRFVSYQGHGRHTDMLLPPHLEANARLLHSIFASLTGKEA